MVSAFHFGDSQNIVEQALVAILVAKQWLRQTTGLVRTHLVTPHVDSDMDWCRHLSVWTRREIDIFQVASARDVIEDQANAILGNRWRVEGPSDVTPVDGHRVNEEWWHISMVHPDVTMHTRDLPLRLYIFSIASRVLRLPSRPISPLRLLVSSLLREGGVKSINQLTSHLSAYLKDAWQMGKRCWRMC